MNSTDTMSEAELAQARETAQQIWREVPDLRSGLRGRLHRWLDKGAPPKVSVIVTRLDMLRDGDRVWDSWQWALVETAASKIDYEAVVTDENLPDGWHELRPLPVAVLLRLSFPGQWGVSQEIVTDLPDRLPRVLKAVIR